MKEPRLISDYLRDMQVAGEKCLRFIDGFTYETFVQDEKTISAVVRELEVIGEAAKRIPEDARQLNLAIPSKAICGMRDRVIHSYFDVQLDIVWSTISEGIPELLAHLETLQQKLSTAKD